jgi:chromosomal replication initiator protein
LLLLDDVQHLVGKAEAPAELLRLIDRAQARSLQVVLASDRPPADLDGIDQRLLAHMSGGLIADIAAAEFETRLGILWLWRSVRVVDIDDGALDELARHEVENVQSCWIVQADATAARARSPTAGRGEDRGHAARRGTAAPDEFESF